MNGELAQIIALVGYGNLFLSGGNVDLSSNETPLDCEFRLHRPSFAIISLGTNEAFDVKKDPSTFEGRLRRVIDA